LQYLYDENLVYFDTSIKSFKIELERIRSVILPEDVESLMQLRMREMSEQEIQLLQIAACIGPRVTKYTIHENPLTFSIQLSIALENDAISPDDIEHTLWRALRARFMSSPYTNYAAHTRRFQQPQSDRPSLGKTPETIADI
jgi:hypothetical protein